MKIAKLISLIALALTIVPCLLLISGGMELKFVKWAALAGTIAWFASAPIWMDRKAA